MRLKVSANAAREELVTLVNRGYNVLKWGEQIYRQKKADGNFDESVEMPVFENLVNAWASDVVLSLNSIFPTELESNTFLKPGFPFAHLGGSEDLKYRELVWRLPYFVRGLNEIRKTAISDYTDLPLSIRLFIEDIDSFRKVRDVNPAAVADLLSEQGYLDKSEEEVQIALESILNEAMHKRDWGGEINDLYSANLVLNGNRTASAFLLKGNGLRTPVMQISDCGKNGDQILRLMRSPAQLFVIQYVGNISESVIEDIETKVRALRNEGKQELYYCIINGQDTARILRAYGMG
jgi:hypothetical protein